MSKRLPSFVLAAALLYLSAGAAASFAKEREAAPHGARPVPAPTRKLDEYGNIRWDDEKARLDNLAIELQSDPTARGYLICYGGRVGREGDARRRCTRAKGYVSGHRHVPAEQVVTMDGGFREELIVEVWVVPQGVTPPQPSPTVDAADVRFIKGDAPKRVRRRGRARRN